MGEQIARVRESIRASISNSFMMRKNDSDDERRHIYQIEGIIKEEEKEDNGRDMTDILFPVRELAESSGIEEQGEPNEGTF